MQNNQDREKNLTQQEKVESPVFIDMSEDSSIDRDLQFLLLKKEMAEKEREVECFQAKIVHLTEEIERLNQDYRVILSEESPQQQETAQLKQQLRALSSEKEEQLDTLVKLQANYEGMLGREERYLREIRQLKNQINTQKEALYRTYSYRLGYILIHSTKSFRNFLRLPKDLISLYFDNRRRKSKKKILTVKQQQHYSRRKSTIPLFHKTLEVSHIEAGRKQVRIATIMDEFTAFCFAPEAEILPLTPTHFKEELAGFKPDFLFIESAWQGKEGLWKLKISQQGEELLDLVQYCRDNGIKILFWNKEDPVHFGTFIETAKLADVVFTTDIDCVQKYKEILQHNEVYLLPFAAQPKTHNPIELFERLDKFNFAGSYYLKYPVRQRDFATLTEVAIDSKGLDIYDRNYDNDHPHYQFPDRYQSLILGALPPEEIDRAYKGYEFGINMNTIKQSQTMFARRVFEMLASNTVVLSNYSRGTRLFFGDLVISSDHQQTLKDALKPLLTDHFYRKKFKLEGLRKVFSEHTYAHRLAYILKKMKIEWEVPEKPQKIAVIAQCDTQAELSAIISQFNAQTASHKALLLLTNLPLEALKAANKTSNSASNIATYSDVESLLLAFKEGDYHYASIFNCVNYYGPRYLEDLLHSYRYLQYHQSPPATKGSYYSFSQGVLVPPKGVEYRFIDNHYTTRTLYPTAHFLTLLNQYPLEVLIAGRSLLERAISTDCFSYIQNGAMLDKAQKEQICGDLIVDSGITLEGHLLPIAEAIQFKHYEAPERKEIELNSRLIKETLCPEIKMQQDRHAFHFNASLADSKHRLIKLTEAILVDGWNRLTINSKIEGKGDLLLVVEFLDEKGAQISHVTLAPHSQMRLEIPELAFYSRLNLRMKGNATATLGKEVTLSLQNVIGMIEHETYESDDIVLFTHDEIDQLLVRPKSQQITIQNQKEGLLIRSTMDVEKHAYLYFHKIFSRAEVNLITNSLFETIGSVDGVDLRTVFIFLDHEKEKLSHAILKVDNCSHAMAIPEACEFVRIGFKITGNGSALIHSLKIGELKERINSFVGKSDTLVLAKQYPAYDDLYKYGFLHSRLRAYKKAGTIVDIYRFMNEDIGHFREFESIDLFEGGARELEEALSSGQYKQILIHLIDKKMWDIVKKYQDSIKIFIWIHGAEIQTWQRRAFEFDLMTSDQIERQKKLSDARVKFWQNLLDHEAGENVHFIFVSQYLRAESEEGLERHFPKQQTSVIHNYIDEEIFPYEPKPVEQRYNLLTIRPFAGKKYGNDITVNAILELAKSPQFSQFKIEICGDGPLFDETVEPLKQFENVIINKGFLSHDEMAEKYQQYGVFINPTRWDSQGVSRDEARIAGLVSISSNITAVPEFVSSEDGVLVDVEDYKALADKILWLVENPKDFTNLSINGRARVQEQCNAEQTIYKELRLIEKG